MNDKNSINATNAVERSVKIFDEGNQVLDILALSIVYRAVSNARRNNEESSFDID